MLEHWTWRLWIPLLVEPLDQPFNFTVSVHSCIGMRICACICRRTREWDLRIYSLECQVCVLKGHECLLIPLYQPLSDMATVCVCVFWVMGVMDEFCCRMHLLVPTCSPPNTQYTHIHKNTHTHRVCFNRRLLYYSQKRWKSISAPVSGSFILLVQVLFGQPLADARCGVLLSSVVSLCSLVII